MKTSFAALTVVFLIALVGCTKVAVEQGQLRNERIRLTVDFDESVVLRYRFVSSRESNVDMDPGLTASKAGSETVKKFSEKLEMIVSYQPVSVDPYGVTKVKATVESAKVERSQADAKQPGQTDAVASLAGESFTFTVNPAGKIEDYSDMDRLIRQAGAKAFRASDKHGRVKEPDMVEDFAALQWFLWDSISSIENPVAGISRGQTWKSKLPVPNPLMLREARDVTYKLSAVRSCNGSRIALIASSYAPAESTPSDWVKPYEGTFQMPGTFGFLRTFVRKFKVVSLQGQGTEWINADAGRIEKRRQDYEVQIEASEATPLGMKPKVVIGQHFLMELLEPKPVCPQMPDR